MLGAKDFGIDLGTDFIRICSPGTSLVTEPAIVCCLKGTSQVQAIGQRARKLLESDTERFVEYELKDRGEIHDYSTVRETLHYIVQKNQPFSFLLHPDLLMAIPHGSSLIERKAFRDLCVQAGFNDKGLYFIDELLASAIGAGLPVLEPMGSMIINIGAGNTQAGVFSLGGLVASGSTRLGGRELNRQILEFIRKEYDILIDISAAEKAKRQIGSILPHDQSRIDRVSVKGRNIRTGLPDEASVSTEEMRLAILPAVEEMIDSIGQVLESTPPDIAADLVETGITATGGGILMTGLKELLEEKTGLTIHVADHTQEAVIRGVQKVMQKPSQWSGIYTGLLK